MKNQLLPLLAMMILFIGACSDPQKSGPTPTSIAFLDALEEGDFNQAKKYCSKRSLGHLDRYERMAKNGINPFELPYEIKGEEVLGDRAVVGYEQGGMGKKLMLLKKDGKWQVSASKSDFGDKVRDGIEEEPEESFEEPREEFDQAKEEKEESTENARDTVSYDFPPPPPPPPPPPSTPVPEIEEEEEEIAFLTGEVYLDFRKGKSAREIVEKFLVAIYDSDKKAAMRYASQQTHFTLRSYTRWDSLRAENFSIVEVIEDGDNGMVRFVDDFMFSRSNTIKLGKDSRGNWEVRMTSADLRELP